MSMSVDVSVDDDVLNWRYVFDGDEWKQSVPLHMLFPKPLISIDRGRCWRYVGLTCFVPLAVAGLIQWIGLSPYLVIAAGVGAFLPLGYRYSPWFIGPVEWAVFDTTLKDKTVYMFRGVRGSEFDQFVETLGEAVEAARRNIVNVGEPADARESPS